MSDKKTNDSLEALLAPLKWVDKKILKLYTKIGKKIPEDKLYRVTTGACVAGIGGISLWSYFFAGLPLYLGATAVGLGSFPDLYYNAQGLDGKVKDEMESDSVALDKEQEVCRRYTRWARLPLFLTGVGLLVLSGDIPEGVTGGVGFLGLASSMYLKDQDPKLLNKKPSLAKRIKEWFSPSSELVPRPVKKMQQQEVLAYVVL